MVENWSNYFLSILFIFLFIFIYSINISLLGKARHPRALRHLSQGDYDLPSHQPSQPSWLPRTCGSRSETWNRKVDLSPFQSPRTVHRSEGLKERKVLVIQRPLSPLHGDGAFGQCLVP